MTFRVLDFLDYYRVDYRDHGKNCARGHVVIKCPWCGEDDPSEHLGIQVDGPFAYGCWRNADHRGRNPVRLVQAIMRCSWGRAKDIVRTFGGELSSSTDDLEEAIEGLKKTGKEDKHRVFHVEHVWRTFRRVWTDIGGEPYIRYLSSRGIEDPRRFAETFDLRFALSGKWSKRLLIPVYDIDGNSVLSWTGRSIGSSDIRYLSSKDSDNAFRPNDTVYAPPDGYNGEVLVVLEGPFDAMKLEWYAREMGVRATCMFSLTMNRKQIAALTQLAKRFKRVVLMLDRGEYLKALRLAESIPVDHLEVRDLVEAKDVGEMDGPSIIRLAESLL